MVFNKALHLGCAILLVIRAAVWWIIYLKMFWTDRIKLYQETFEISVPDCTAVFYRGKSYIFSCYITGNTCICYSLRQFKSTYMFKAIGEHGLLNWTIFLCFFSVSCKEQNGIRRKPRLLFQTSDYTFCGRKKQKTICVCTEWRFDVWQDCTVEWSKSSLKSELEEQSRVNTGHICPTVCLLLWGFTHTAKNRLQQTAKTHCDQGYAL